MIDAAPSRQSQLSTLLANAEESSQRFLSFALNVLFQTIICHFDPPSTA
jgi:hypothetical protein